MVSRTVLERQISANSGRNLLYERSFETLSFDPVFLECLKQPGTDDEEFERTLAWLVRRTLKELFAVALGRFNP